MTLVAGVREEGRVSRLPRHRKVQRACSVDDETDGGSCENIMLKVGGSQFQGRDGIVIIISSMRNIIINIIIGHILELSSRDQ